MTYDFKESRAPEEGGGGRWMRVRVALVGAVLLMGLSGDLLRAVQLQVFERSRFLDMAEGQYLRQVEIPARRGDIFDRKGTPLGQSVEVDSLWADPSMLPDRAAAAKLLGARLKEPAAQLLQRFERGKRFAWIKRGARPEEVAAVRDLKLPGVLVVKEPRRFYPQRELAAQVLGMVGVDGRGLEGVELAFDDELTGQSAQVPGLRDARGRQVLTAGAAPAQERQGASVTLTLDGNLEHLAERALERAVADSRAVSGMVVVLDPRTGELLALANSPRFNPNTPKDAHAQAMRDRAALDTFEPGSTMKAFTVAAALEERAIKPADAFFCENGAWDVGRDTINDTHPWGWLSTGKILQVSSNIGSAKIAQALGRERFVEYLQRFGFGERVGLGLPGEGKGVLPFPRAEIALANQAFGQGLTATAVQLAAGYGALANGGALMRPFLVSKVVDPDGVVLLESRPVEVRRAVSPKTARTVLAMLEGVVADEGTAPKARMPGYRVAGKTGTAQKADPVARGYSDKRIASFVGVVPADAPRLVIAVVIDEPQTDKYGGLSAAPAFKEIADGAMAYLGVPSHPVAMAAVNPEPAPPPQAAPPPPAARTVVAEAPLPAGANAVLVPDLTGRVSREAVNRLLAASLEPHLRGTGRVVGQTPEPGSRVERGSQVTVDLQARP
ncbi:MAG TPA: penicillin-binding protein [Myxococcaceae bacterium]|jgi:cell division protein FtsI (penicillin-binding protein 3)